MYDFSGKVILVTGAAKGIGRKTAEMFAESGASTIFTDIDAKEIAECCQEQIKLGRKTAWFELDVSKVEQVIKVFSAVIEKFGKLDILVNNAGIVRDSTLIKMTDEQFDLVIDVHLKGVFYCGREAAKIMKQQKSGVIINLSSESGLKGNFGQTNYTAAKWGIIGMTKTWSKELGKYGIRSCAVAPRVIETDMTKTIPQEILEKDLETVDLRRVGKPEDVANGIMFLASDYASFITGTVLEIMGTSI